MSTEYIARARMVLSYFDWSDLPKKLVEQTQLLNRDGVKEPYFVIGTRYGNGKVEEFFRQEYRKRRIMNLGVDLSEFGISMSEVFADLTDEDFERILSSGKSFYSKWSKDSPLLLHTKSTRFHWHTVGREFWEKVPREVEVKNNNNDIEIKMLGDLFDSLYGPNARIEPVEDLRYGMYRIPIHDLKSLGII